MSMVHQITAPQLRDLIWKPICFARPDDAVHLNIIQTSSENSNID